MIVPTEISQRYQQDDLLLDHIAKDVKDTVLRFCEQNGYAYLGRRKKIDSLAEKLESGRYANWSELDDLFACSIVIPTLRHESTAIDFLESTFQTRTIRKRGSTKKPPDQFRFDSTRYIGSLPVLPGMEPNSLQTIPFEVQIKSAFDHAWAVATHDLVYKSKEIDWKRMRLAGQMKAVVEQLDALALAFEQTTDHITESVWEEIESKKKIAFFFNDLIEKKVIPEEARPKDISRFADNILSLCSKPDTAARLDNLFAAIEDELKQNASFPLQLSLFQFAYGVASSKENVLNVKANYSALVTEALTARYPKTKDCLRIFDFQFPEQNKQEEGLG